MSISKIFGVVLHDLRVEKGLSQEHLAELCSLDRTFISMLERGLRQPTLSSLFTLSEGLGVSPSELVKKVEDLR